MSHDIEQESPKKPEVKVKKRVFLAGFLKYSNRKKLCDLSEKALGARYQWQRLIKKGYLINTLIETANGKKLAGKKTEYPNLREVYEYMLEKIKAAEVAKRAAEENRFDKKNLNSVV